MASALVRRVAENFSLPYFTLTPTYTICPVHGYIPGAHFTCPHHDEESADGYLSDETSRPKGPEENEADIIPLASGGQRN